MTQIKLVVSDCDGTLITPDKALTEAAIAAVDRLHAASIGFALTSSRPPYGMSMFAQPLSLTLPLGAFNGSFIVQPDMTPLAKTFVPRQSAEAALEVLRRFDVDAWVFTPDHWLIEREDGDYVAHEQQTIQFAPMIVDDFGPHMNRVCKIVGASSDAAKLVVCEESMREALGPGAHAARSQTYYLDVTPPGHDKGSFVDALAERLGLQQSQIATIGDMANDVPMFRRSGVSIAMGNAPDEVKAAATHTTDTNTRDGFAKAIERVLALT